MPNFWNCQLSHRLMISGSAALPVPVLEKWEQITGHRLLERYGMTEIGMALTNPLHGERKPGELNCLHWFSLGMSTYFTIMHFIRLGYVGAPFESVRVRVADITKDNVTVLADGGSKNIEILSGEKSVIGELLIKGPSVFKEYLKNPEATRKEFTSDGWFITGTQTQKILLTVKP